MSRLRRALAGVGISGAVFVVAFLLVDTFVVPRLVAPRRPAAYAKSDYWGPDFLRESAEVADLRSIRQTPMGPVNLSGDYRGRWINVDQGFRRTVPRPASPSRRIVVLGGSTTFCVEVPDELTWPSQLAARLESTSTEVINAGLSGATLEDRLDVAERLDLLRPGDLAVFFVGVNDAVVGSQRNQPIGALARWPRLRTAIQRLFGWSNSGRLALARGQELRFEIELEPREAAERFLPLTARALQVASRRGADALVVLQPAAIFGDRRGWSRTIAALNPDYQAAFVEFYEIVLRAPVAGGAVTDGTEIFDELDESPYLDFAHVQEDGNRAIADFVYEELAARGWLD